MPMLYNWIWYWTAYLPEQRNDEEWTDDEKLHIIG